MSSCWQVPQKDERADPLQMEVRTPEELCICQKRGWEDLCYCVHALSLLNSDRRWFMSPFSSSSGTTSLELTTVIPGKVFSRLPVSKETFIQIPRTPLTCKEKCIVSGAGDSPRSKEASFDFHASISCAVPRHWNSPSVRLAWRSTSSS